MTRLETMLQTIDHRKAQLDALRPLPLEQLQTAFDIEYTYESNRIEGNTLTLRETDLVVQKGLTIAEKSLREHLEAINHFEAVQYIRELATQTDSITPREIKNIHALILRAIDQRHAGVYRSVPVAISGSRHVPPQPWEVPILMERFEDWLRLERPKLHPVLQAAEAHERLVTIHPFIDGNGRTSRLIMNLILLQYGYTIANLKGDTPNRLRYYDALEKCNINADRAEFYELIAEAVLEGLDGLLGRLGVSIQN